MRQVELSNHPADLLQEAQQRRLAQDQQAWAQYENDLELHLQRLGGLRRMRAEALSRFRLLEWMRHVMAVLAEHQRRPSPPYPSAAVDEGGLAAGVAGEQQVVIELGGMLGDDWVLMHGYRNRYGEIDFLLLGPRGLVAIEVKFRNASVSCEGDAWWFEKYDRYGNLVEEGMLTDRRGRSPSRQLNEPADALQAFLALRQAEVPITRVLLFNHPFSILASLSELTVDLVATSTADVLSFLDESDVTLSSIQQAKIDQLIQRDHRHHEARHGSRSGPHPRPGGAR